MQSNWQTWAAFGDSRKFFAAVRAAVPQLDEARYVVEYGIEMRGGSSIGHNPNPPDPTGNAATYLADNADELMLKAKRKIEYCENLIGVALVVIASVHDGLGDRHADMVELHYVGALSIAECAKTLDMSISTVKRDISIAHDWCDCQSHRLFTGDYIT